MVKAWTQEGQIPATVNSVYHSKILRSTVVSLLSVFFCLYFPLGNSVFVYLISIERRLLVYLLY